MRQEGELVLLEQLSRNHSSITPVPVELWQLDRFDEICSPCPHWFITNRHVTYGQLRAGTQKKQRHGKQCATTKEPNRLSCQDLPNPEEHVRRSVGMSPQHGHQPPACPAGDLSAHTHPRQYFTGSTCLAGLMRSLALLEGCIRIYH